MPVREFAGGPEEEEVKGPLNGKVRQRFAASPYLVLKRAIMRKLILLCCALQCGLLSAQNWALINPDYKYNYSNDGTDTISNQIFVTHVDTLGADSFRYALNRIGSRCEPCPDAPASCDNGSGVHTGMAQFIGGQILRSGAEIRLIDMDTLLIIPWAPDAANWPSPSGGLATILSSADTIIWGQADSVKTVQYADGRSLRISKMHGVIHASDTSGEHLLIGVQGGINAGVHFPEIIDFFNYQPGDILQYSGEHGGTDGICYTDIHFQRKYTVLSRMELPGRTNYELRLVRHQVTISQPVWGPPSEWCTSSITSGVDTVLLGIEHAAWTEENFFANEWLTHHWPGAFASTAENTFQGEFGSSYHGFIWQAYLDTEGRTCLKPEQHTQDPGAWPAESWCDQDSTFWPQSYDEVKNLFTSGIGLTSASYFIFEHSGGMDLIGYDINGQQWGTITADDLILGVAEQRSEADRFRVRQNPATGSLVVEHAEAGAYYQVLDILGTVRSTGRFSSGTETIRIGDLSDGAYILRSEGQPALRFIVAR